jgi:hypothetical protein
MSSASTPTFAVARKLDIDIAPPDLNAYEVNDHDPE